MSYLVLKLKKKLKFRINLGLLTPDKIVNKQISTIKSLKITYGKEKKEISNFFSVSGKLKKGIHSFQAHCMFEHDILTMLHSFKVCKCFMKYER